ncbi:MarR family transcriptional regulator [Actinocrispum sp. NPDC049592]|uniref:MarR family winged helix-turn-helix transcriptional regulator n=1 Tax=Actinocrispum sp. NPDC049592 TaxID=3154835 RepID=UPI00342B344E
MNDVKPLLRSTVAFRMGLLGTLLTTQFGDRIAAELDLKPKHAGLLVALDTHGTASQQELATMMGVAPSLVVALADHLEELGAIERVRSGVDRRRMNLTLTGEGHALLVKCDEIAQSLSEDLTAGLTKPEREKLQTLLATLAAHHNIPH